MASSHPDLTFASTEGIHYIQAGEPANAGARTGGSYVAADEGKVYRDLDTDTWHILTDSAGPTFLPVAGAPIGAVLTTDSVWMGVAGVAAEVVRAGVDTDATTHIASDGTDHANVVLNDTHRASDGTNHANVVLNDTHRASDGTNHANVVLNDTHRASVGTDHANVVLNDTHRASVGTDHANVVLNDTHRASDGTDHANVVLNDTHRASNGTDHANVVTNDAHVAGDGSDHADVATNTTKWTRQRNYTQVTGATYTVLTTDHFIGVSRAGVVAVTLPTVAAAGEGFTCVIKDELDAGANTITIDGNGAETIDNAADTTLTIQYQSVSVYCDGTEWWIF